MRQRCVAALLGLVWVWAAGCSPFSPTDGGEPDAGVAAWLPGNTTGYLRLADVPRLNKALAESGIKGLLLRGLDLNEGPEAAEARAWIKLAEGAKALHVSFHGAREFPKGTQADVLLVADVGQAVRLQDWLPPRAAKAMAKATTHRGVTLYRWPAEKLSVSGVFAASTGTYVLACTDLALLEDTLDAMKDGRRNSLARNQTYRRATEGLTERDCLAYESICQLMKTIAALTAPYDRDDFYEVAEILSLADVRSLSMGVDYSLDAATVRVCMDPDSKAYQLLARPGSRRVLPGYLPGDGVTLVSLAVGDGAETWRKIKRHISRKMLRLGTIKSLKEFDEYLEKAEKEANVSFDEIASHVQGEVGMFFHLRDRMPTGGFLCTVKDAARAKAFIARVVAGSPLGKKPLKKHQCCEVEIHVAKDRHEDFVWAVVDNVAILSPHVEMVERCIQARKDKKTLDRAPAYGRVAALLPSRNCGLILLNLGALPFVMEVTESIDGDGRRTEQTIERRGLTMPYLLATWAKGMLIGIAYTAEDGVIEVRVAQGRENILRSLWDATKGAMGDR